MIIVLYVITLYRYYDFGDSPELSTMDKVLHKLQYLMRVGAYLRP